MWTRENWAVARELCATIALWSPAGRLTNSIRLSAISYHAEDLLLLELTVSDTTDITLTYLMCSLYVAQRSNCALSHTLLLMVVHVKQEGNGISFLSQFTSVLACDDFRCDSWLYRYQGNTRKHENKYFWNLIWTYWQLGKSMWTNLKKNTYFTLKQPLTQKNLNEYLWVVINQIKGHHKLWIW